ncbi:unnamed protein product [Caenorhabditis bovis]|uniref:Uncharacterized protein n=1 Tax=Caenorhabditis bovis TaxID=2654633 RepID=A0A8S1EQW6_9PELO|nr:unnamed protein product [Caenorhabditis bovis]
MFSSQTSIETKGEEVEEEEEKPTVEPTPIVELDDQTAAATEALKIRGKKMAQSLRPRTSPYKNNADDEDRSGSPDSIAATYTIRDNRTERQTRIKLESLERRLRANEKSRKEIELEVEKWRRLAERNSKRLPELEIELAEATQARDEWMAKSQELEVLITQLTQERDELQKRLDEMEDRVDGFSRKISVLMDVGEEPKDLEGVEKEISNNLEKIGQLEKENMELKDAVQMLSSKLTTNQDNVSTLMNQLESSKIQSSEIHGICRKELEIRQEHEHRINHDVTILNSTVNEQKHELEMLKSEIRCLRSYSQEMSNSNRNNIILLKAAETERRSFLETLVVLLNENIEATENDIKKTIRDLVRAKNSEQTKRLEAEKKAANAEAILLDQAKNQRSALFRARLSEEEYAKAEEKIAELEQELLASDLERKNLEHQISNLDNCVAKVSQLLDVPSTLGGVFDGIFERIEYLLQQEAIHKLVLNENRLISDGIIRSLQGVKKELSGSEKKGLKTLNIVEKLNKDFLTTVTIETLKAADLEKHTMKKKMSEQEQKIRQLEREKKEGERIRSIIAKWEKRQNPKDGVKAFRSTPSIDHVRTKSQTSMSATSQT